MKKLFTVIAIAVVMTMLLCGNQNSNKVNAQSNLSDKKILIVYFSWSSSGNTRYMAEQIKEATGADIFEIVPVNAYPTEYRACVNQAKVEINSKFKPEIKGKVENFDAYDIIIVGSPNWWRTIAPPVATFLTSYDFKGKIIMPFMTHEGSRLGRTVKDIKELCPNATVTSGLAIRGGKIRNAKTANDIQKWLKDNSIIK
jgi:flavodoxin